MRHERNEANNVFKAYRVSSDVRQNNAFHSGNVRTTHLCPLEYKTWGLICLSDVARNDEEGSSQNTSILTQSANFLYRILKLESGVL